MKLLSVGKDSPKASKGNKLGYMTGVLYLAPSDLSGVMDVCPMAEIAGCKKACLNTAGFGSFDRVQQARINRTRSFFENGEGFINEVVNDIQHLIKKADREKMVPTVRLNGTSDILWERIGFNLNEKNAKKIGVKSGYYENIFKVFPNLQFYDYTKMTGRRVPSNYDLTFSYSGANKYQRQVTKAVEENMRIAVVFRSKKNIPNEFLGMKVICGDNTDVRHLEPNGVVVSLYAKGKAKTDTTGFVVD